MTTYDVYQQVFGLSLASNAVRSCEGSQSYLQQKLEAVLPGLIAPLNQVTWTIVWGPVVYQTEVSEGPDNAWYVARNTALKFDDGSVRDTYVVAIAGSVTDYDWIVEDFEVDYVVDFLAWIKAGITTSPPTGRGDAEGTYVAAGTAGAVYTLLTQAAPPNAAGAGLTLHDFISTLSPASGSRLIFTGHSLGGALSPTLALALVKSNNTTGFLQGDVLAYPTAGPSPGNSNFTQLFNGAFPKTAGSGYKIWNCNIVNSLDIVPQAWCTNKTLSPLQNLKNIPPIYGRPTVPDVVVAVLLAEGDANESKMTYMPLQDSTFQGQTPPVPTDKHHFVATAKEQHVCEYMNFINVHPPTVNICGDSEKTKEEVYLTYPVIGHIAWANAHEAEVAAAIAAAVAKGAPPFDDPQVVASVETAEAKACESAV